MILAHGGNIYYYSRKYGIPADEILDFSASINPIGPSPRALRAIRSASASLDSYPDPDSTALTGALSDYLDVPEGSILAANGSTELIYLLPRALKPKRVVVLTPGFSDYERAARLAGCAVRRLSLNEKKGFMPDMAKIKNSLSRNDMIFLCNPNNPTGVMVRKEAVLELVDAAWGAGAFVVVDEAFIEYCPGSSVTREASRTRGVAVLRNFTKFFALPGLRAGYMTAAPKLIERLKAVREPWSVNSLAQAAGAASLKDTAYMKKSMQIVDSERSFLFDALSGIKGLIPYPSSANFVLVRLEKGTGSSSLAEELASKGILIRDCYNFRGLDGRFIRVAVRTRAENERLVRAFKSSEYFTAD